MPPPMPIVCAWFGGLVGGFDVVREAEGHAGRRQQGEQDDGEAVGGQPAEEGGTPLHAAVACVLGGHRVALGAARDGRAVRGSHGSVRIVLCVVGHGPSSGRAGPGGTRVRSPHMDARSGTGQNGTRGLSPGRATCLTCANEGEGPR